MLLALLFVLCAFTRSVAQALVLWSNSDLHTYVPVQSTPSRLPLLVCLTRVHTPSRTEVAESEYDTKHAKR
jgi:hypothetical protein